jgi:hypothetical protein
MRRVWDLAVEVVRLEVALYACLWRWITRRPDVPAGARPIPYAQLSAPMVWLFVFGSGIEVIVIEVILRSLDQAWADAIRLPVLILGIWGVIWMIGLAAAYRTRPHLLTSEALYARSFALTDVAVPLSAIKKVSAVEQEVEGDPIRPQDRGSAGARGLESYESACRVARASHLAVAATQQALESLGRRTQGDGGTAWRSGWTSRARSPRCSPA